MRKRTISDFFDNLLWFIVYTLPLWLYVIQLCVVKAPYFEEYTLFDIMQSVGFTAENPIFQVLVNLFTLTIENETVLPLFDGYGVAVVYASYFISCFLLHLFVDVILCIPRVCHSLIAKASKKE